MTRAVVAIEPFDRGMTLAAQAFTSIFPLVIALAAVLPGDRPLADVLADNLQVPPQARAALEAAIPADTGSRAAFGVVGVLVVLVSGTSYARALARMYGRIWVARPSGWRRAWRWIAILVGVVLVAGTLRLFEKTAVAQAYGSAGLALATLVLNVACWTWVPWLLLARQVSWRALAPGGVLMGLATVVTSRVSTIYLPLALATSARHYGALGIAFTYISWFFVVSFVLIVTAVVGATLVREIPPLRRWARLDVTEPADSDPSPA
jgi:membrane protein